MSHVFMCSYVPKVCVRNYMRIASAIMTDRELRLTFVIYSSHEPTELKGVHKSSELDGDLKIRNNLVALKQWVDAVG